MRMSAIKWNDEEILQMIREDPKIDFNKLAKEYNVEVIKVKTHIAKLCKDGILVNRRNGYYFEYFVYADNPEFGDQLKAASDAMKSRKADSRARRKALENNRVESKEDTESNQNNSQESNEESQFNIPHGQSSELGSSRGSAFSFNIDDARLGTRYLKDPDVLSRIDNVMSLIRPDDPIEVKEAFRALAVKMFEKGIIFPVK